MKPNKLKELEKGSDDRDVLTAAEKERAIRLIGLDLYKGHGKNGLTFKEMGSVGSRDSAHDVFFATADRASSVGVADTIVVKRFRRPESAEAEMTNLAEAERRGFTTVQPAGKGLYDLGDLGTALVTNFVPNLTTMNRIGWGNHIVGQQGYGDLATTLRQIGGFVGRLHGAGIIHDDLQVKNIGRAPVFRPGYPPQVEPIVFDVEGAKFFDPDAPEGSDDAVKFAGSCGEDLDKLLRSLVDRRFLAAASDGIFEQEVSDNLLTPYFDNGGSSAVLDQYDMLMGNAIDLRHQTPGLSPLEIGRLALV